MIANVSGQPYADKNVRKNLLDQLTQSVQWTKSIQYLISQGAQGMEFEEIGHGRVLTKLIDQIQKETLLLPEDIDESSIQVNKKDEEVVVKIDGDVDKKVDENQNEGTLSQQDSTSTEEIDIPPAELIEGSQALSADEKVGAWNKNYGIGTKVKSLLIDDEGLETRTAAQVLFGHRAAVYLEGYNGYFDLDEIIALDTVKS